MVNDQAGRWHSLEGDLPGPAVAQRILQRLVAATFVDDRQAFPHRVAGNLGEDTPFEVEGAEEIGVGQQHLGLAEEQDAALLQREVQPG